MRKVFHQITRDCFASPRRARRSAFGDGDQNGRTRWICAPRVDDGGAFHRLTVYGEKPRDLDAIIPLLRN